jgi:hypothetical protein
MEKSYKMQQTASLKKVFCCNDYSREETIKYQRKLFKGGKYSRAETIRGNTVNVWLDLLLLVFLVSKISKIKVES